ncbi:MAG: ABC transporter ATP-binding protein [Burkholderiaceae bacterium]
MNAGTAVAPEPVLQVQGLTTRFHTGRGTVHAVEDVSFVVRSGETLGLVGESGSGKSVTAMSLLNLVREPGRIEAGQILFRGRDILALSNKELRGIRGNGLSMVFQDPMSSLNPIMRIGEQITEAIHGKGRTSAAEARERAVTLMRLVGIPDPALRLADYPHRFSGGMRQRVMIAMALANEPGVIVADEPTTALDVTVQAQILDVLADINRQLGTAIILITHNLGVVARSCDRVAVMYAGRIVEQARTTELFADPRHPYTQALLAATPRLLASRSHALMPIEGQPPSLADTITGCAFAPRCHFAHAACQKQPPTTELGERSFACWKSAGGEPLPQLSRRTGHTLPTVADAQTGPGSTNPEHMPGNPPQLLEVRDLVVRFAVPSASVNPFAPGRQLHAVDGVSFTLGHAETVGLVGESGCGKSSLGKALMGVNPVAQGQVVFDGRDVTHLRGEQRQWVRRQLQMVFQDPMSALNPRMIVGDALAEPLIVHGLCKDAAQVRRRVGELMHLVGLDAASATRYPHEFSGGQRQRIVIARGLAVGPRLLVCDEAVAALDVSLQAQVINLLKDLQARLGLSMLFIGHDLASVRYVSDRILVMYLGQVVEEGPAETLTLQPQHPYTVSLLSAVPEPDPAAEATRQRVMLTGDLPSPLDPPSGCRFRTRCPIGPAHREGRERCITEPPALKPVGGSAGSKAACHFAGEMTLAGATSSRVIPIRQPQDLIST